MRSRIIVSFVLTLALCAACGGESAEPAAPPPPSSAGADIAAAPEPEPETEPNPNPMPTADPELGDRSPALTALLGTANVSVYVLGPNQASEGELTAGDEATFEAEVRIVNEGEQELDVEEAEIRFEVWSDDGERTACADVDDTMPPSEVEDESAELHRGLAECSFPEAGEYEVRTYVGFESGTLDGDFDLERHYAGRTEVTVGGG